MPIHNITLPPSSPFIQYGGYWDVTIESVVGSNQRNSTFAIDFFGTAIYVYATVDHLVSSQLHDVIPSLSMSLDGVLSNYTVTENAGIQNSSPYDVLFAQSGLALGWHHLNVSMGRFGPDYVDLGMALQGVDITTGVGLTRFDALHRSTIGKRVDGDSSPESATIQRTPQLGMVAVAVVATAALFMIVIIALVGFHLHKNHGRRKVRVTFFDDGPEPDSPVARAQDMAPPDYQLVFPPGSEGARLQEQARDAHDALATRPSAPRVPEKVGVLSWRLDKEETLPCRPTEPLTPRPRAPVPARKKRAH